MITLRDVDSHALGETTLIEGCEPQTAEALQQTIATLLRKVREFNLPLELRKFEIFLSEALSTAPKKRRIEMIKGHDKTTQDDLA